MSSRLGLGENLIFVISQPRAGSTLIQRILGCHPDIHTVSEPWLMLHPLYGLKSGAGFSADYDAELARKAVQNFLRNMSSGEEELVRGMRHMYGNLYAKALESSGKRFFLDKTPRYYFIIPELYRTFPQAHFIILIRNPVAVLCSIINAWVKGKWHRLKKYRFDLIRAPVLLVEGAEMLGDHGLAVSYEKLLEHPENEAMKMCQWFGVDVAPNIVQYGQAALPRWSLGDQENVYQRIGPDSDGANNWLFALDNPQTWRVANDYLDFLGKELVEKMGYRYEELRGVVEARRPSRTRLWFTSSMMRLLTKPNKKPESS
ncbi:MAG: sulfotransferase family protein [Candidatus Binatia bacterium]